MKLFQNLSKFDVFSHILAPAGLNTVTNATNITVLLGGDCQWDGNSDAYTICCLMNEIIILTTRILPFHPVTDSRYFCPTTLLTSDWTVRVEHCCEAMRRRDTTLPRF